MPFGTGILSGTAAFILGGVLIAGAAVYDAGAIRIRVDEKKPDGTHLHLIAPAAVVPAGLHFIPDEKLLEASREMRPWIPAIKIAITQLEKYQDFTLVEVDDAHDHVRITKRDGEIAIDVDSDEEVVHVSVPLKTMMSAVERVERARGYESRGGDL